MPNADGDLDLPARGFARREGRTLEGPAAISNRVGRHLAVTADLLSVGVDLIVRIDVRQQQGEMIQARRRLHFEAIPGHAGVAGIALARPAFAGAQQWPLRVVKARVGPPGVVPGVEAPDRKSVV